MPAAMYLPAGAPDTWVATEHTIGPWDPGLQHGGPPAALLARAVERTEWTWPGTVSRLSIDLLGPVPVGEVTVQARVERPGRSVDLVVAELAAAGRVAVRLRAWRVRRSDAPVPVTSYDGDVPPLPDADGVLPPEWPPGFLTAMQWRFTSGSWSQRGPATTWARMAVPLVPDESPSGLQRLMVLADCGNGLSHVLPLTGWWFINPDLTVHLTREPVGEWMLIDAATSLGPDGTGVAATRLADGDGWLGRGAQTLYVGRR